MSNLISAAREQWKELLLRAYEQAVADGVLPSGAAAVDPEPPRDPSHGDWASSFALAAAKTLGKPPRMIAEAVRDRVELTGSFFATCAVAGAGFLNGRLGTSFFAALLADISREGEAYGRNDLGHGKPVMVEFVSANPTGPMTLGNARGGVLGDTLASVLSACGYKVSREFYLNDAGHQVDMFGRSIDARYIQLLRGEDAYVFPEDGYHGEYIREFAAAFAEQHGDSFLDKPDDVRREAMAAFALPQNVRRMKDDLARYGIVYDRFFHETELHNSGYVKETIDLLTERGHTYEKDGALWFEATKFGCDKDEVMQKSNGFFTYFAVDIAYHRNKFVERAFDTAIDVLGADHHGHTLRFAAAMEAIGVDPARLRFVLMQLVHLTRDGEVVRMSKRTGRAITLSDLLDEIPVDAARFFFNNRQTGSHLEFDMGLAVRQDSDNPVYYVQYAHARLCSLLRELAAEGFAPPEGGAADVSLLSTPQERELLAALAAFPEEIALAAQELEPFRINRHLIKTAAAYHRFYNECRVKGSDKPLLLARLALCASARTMLRNGLGLLGVSAPEKM